MPFQTMEAPIGAQTSFQAWGATREELFVSCAQALLGTMASEDATKGAKVRTILDIQEEDIESLLAEFLEEIIYYKNIYQLLLMPAMVEIEWEGEDERYFLLAKMRGAPCLLSNDEGGRTVKSVKSQGVKVSKDGDAWYAMVNLEI